MLPRLPRLRDIAEADADPMICGKEAAGKVRSIGNDRLLSENE